jgi:hypothetical protein
VAGAHLAADEAQALVEFEVVARQLCHHFLHVTLPKIVNRKHFAKSFDFRQQIDL